MCAYCYISTLFSHLWSCCTQVMLKCYKVSNSCSLKHCIWVIKKTYSTAVTLTLHCSQRKAVLKALYYMCHGNIPKNLWDCLTTNLSNGICKGRTIICFEMLWYDWSLNKIFVLRCMTYIVASSSSYEISSCSAYPSACLTFYTLNYSITTL